MKRTYQPKKLKRLRKFGFRARSATPGGKNVLKRRRNKGRKSLSANDEFKLLRKTPRKGTRTTGKIKALAKVKATSKSKASLKSK